MSSKRGGFLEHEPDVKLPLRLLMVGLVVSALASRAGAQTPVERSTPLVVATRGQLPILLSGPHGGQEKIPQAPPRSNKGAFRFTTGRDVNTDILVDAIADELQARFDGKRPFVVRAKFHRRYLDVNRRPGDAYEAPAAQAVYEAYHAALAGYCAEIRRQWGHGLLLDVHGQVARVDAVVRGTNDGKTDELLRRRFGEGAHFGPQSLIGRLAESGLKVHPTAAGEKELPSFRGGYIVQTYGSHERFAIDAVQLEFGSNLRRTDAVRETARKAAEAIERFARQYLPNDKR